MTKRRSTKLIRGDVLGFYATTIALVAGSILAFAMYSAGTDSVLSLSDQQIAEAGGIAVFRSDETLTVDFLSVSLGPTVANGNPFVGNADAIADLADPSMEIFFSVNQRPDAGESHLLFILWGNARLVPSSVGVLDVPLIADTKVRNPSIVDETSVGDGLGCSTGGTDPTLLDAGDPEEALQLIDLRLSPGDGGRYAAIRGERVATGVATRGANIAATIPAWSDGFPFPIRGDEFLPNDQCSTPSILEREDDGAILVKREFRPAQTPAEIRAGRLAPDQDLLLVDPEPRNARQLVWYTEDYPVTSSSFDTSVRPAVVISSRGVSSESTNILFLSGALIGFLGGLAIEWVKLASAVHKRARVGWAIFAIGTLIIATVACRLSTSYISRAVKVKRR